MRGATGRDDLATEQLFLLQVLQLSSRRSAVVEQRAQRATSLCLSDVHTASLLSSTAHVVLPRNGEAATKQDLCRADIDPHASTPPSSASHARPHFSVAVPRHNSSSSTDDAADKQKEGDKPMQEVMTHRSPTSSATAFAEETELAAPQSPQSPMRRMLEMKSAQPVRRPRRQDVIPPHRLSIGDGLNVKGEDINGGADGVGLPGGGSASRGSRVDVAKATLQQDIGRRTLSSLGLPPAADVSATRQPPQRRRISAAAQDGPCAGAVTEVPLVSTSVRRRIFPLDDTVNEETTEEVHAFTKVNGEEEDGAERNADNSNNTAANSNGLRTTASTNTTAATAAVSTSPLDAADDLSGPDRHASPVVTTDSFRSFLQRLCAASPPTAPGTLPVSTALNFDTHSGRAPCAATATMRRNVIVADEHRKGTGEHSTSLTDVGLLTVASSSESEKSPTTSQYGVRPSLSLSFAPPPPPPSLQEPLPRTNLDAENSFTAQELVAHVRLAQPWTIVAAQKWHRPHAEDNNSTNNNISSSSGNECSNDAPLTSPTSTDLPTIHQRQLSSSMDRCRLTVNSNIKDTVATASAAMCVPPFLQDGEATLVSDRVDAVLPTWAYLASHAAVAAPAPALSSPVVGPPQSPAAIDATASMPASTTSRRARWSRNSSFTSSVTRGVFHDIEEWMKEERRDVRLCLFPYELAEACALGRLHRARQRARFSEVSAKETAGAAVMAGTLHLLRLELLLDVRQVQPTACVVSAKERQTLLEKALEEFTASDVLPTTVLRGVLNDAALRLLSSVDRDVLRRIAGEVESKNGKDGPTASHAEVVPLGLHVHTVQGDTTSSVVESSTAVQQPPPSTFIVSVHSATTSTISVGTSSLWPPSEATPVARTQLTLTILLHVSALNSSSSISSTAVDVDEALTLHGKDSGRSGSNTTATKSPAASGYPDKTNYHDMTEDTALSIAAAVLPHLFPLSFALSRSATRLSISSEVDYDALNSVSDISPSTSTNTGEEAGKQPPQKDETKNSAATEHASRPWTWVDVDLAALRAACGFEESRMPVPNHRASAAAVVPRSLQEDGSGVHAVVVERTDTHTQPSKQTLPSVAETTAATEREVEPQHPPHAQHDSLREEEEGEQQHLEGCADASTTGAGVNEESVEASDASKGRLRCDIVKETAGLTTVSESLQRQLECICSCATLSGLAMPGLEETNESRKGITKLHRTRKGHGKAASKQKLVRPLTYAEELGEYAKATSASTTALLVDAMLYNAKTHTESSDDAPTVDASHHRSSLSSSHTLWSRWFDSCAHHLVKEVCEPLEQLEAFILESSSSSFETSLGAAAISVEDVNGSASGGSASTIARHVLGTQVALKATRRRRQRQLAGGASTGAARPEKTGGSDTRQESSATAAADESFSPCCILPSLGIAKAMVQLCHDVADKTRMPSSLLSSSSEPNRDLCETVTEEGSTADNTTASEGVPVASQPTLGSLEPSFHPRSFSTSSGASSMRVLGSSSVAQALQEHTHALHDGLRRVQTQLEVEGRRWATLRMALTCLETEWQCVQEILNEEVAERQKLQITCAAGRQETEEKVKTQLADEAPAEATIELEKVAAAAPAPPPLLPSFDEARVEEQKKDMQRETAKATLKLETRTGNNNNSRLSKISSPSTSPAPDPAASTSVIQRATSQLSNTSDTSSRGPARSPQTSLNNSNTTVTNSVKKLRCRNKQQPQPQQPLQRRSNFGTPLLSSPSSSGFASPTTRTTNSSAYGLASVDAVNRSSDKKDAAQIVRRVPQAVMRGLLHLHLDSVLMRQAAPFVVMGTILCFLFLLL